MADTRRSTATLLASTLADNAAGDITPQDARDVLVSGQCYGGIYVADGSATESWTTTPAKIGLFAADMPSAGCTPAHASDQITVDGGTGDGAGDWYVAFHLSLRTTAGGASTIEVHVYINGVESYIGAHRYLSGSNDRGSLGSGGFVTLADGDVLTLYGESTVGGGVTIEINDAQFYCWRAA